MIATPEYLIGLRKLCDEQDLLLLFDEVQAGIFGRESFTAGKGFWKTGKPILCLTESQWPRDLAAGFRSVRFGARKLADVLSAGTHGEHVWRNAVGVRVALRVLDVVERNDLAANARCIGELFIDRLRRMQGKYPRVVREVRGLGLMIGIEFQPTFGPLPENKNPLQFKLWTDCMKKVS